jgi:mono/diheme cytochrome c family protein
MSSRNSLKRVATIVLVFAGLTCFAGAREGAVSGVAGRSWLDHLTRPFEDSSMGKTGHLGPPALDGDASHWRLALSNGIAADVSVHGADLYRLNCRSCHGEAGLGAPPEINSVINPVRATSIALVLERMKATGMAMSRSDAAKMADESKSALLHRLHGGGQDMPAFPHLSDTEIQSLIAYLKQLSGMPGAEHEQTSVRESPVRIGEHIAKSTCHICHSAYGANPSPQQIAQGAIPPLSALTSRVSLPEFVRKVTAGAPILMGEPAAVCRGRMPVFYYLSQDEAADVYLYLTLYPPYKFAALDPSGPPLQVDQAGMDAALSQISASSVGSDQTPPSPGSVAADVYDINAAPSLGFGLFLALLLAAGFAFTIRECTRLSESAEGRAYIPQPVLTDAVVLQNENGAEEQRLIA